MLPLLRPLALLCFLILSASAFPRSDQLIDIHTVIPDIAVEVRYFGTDNFVGTKIDGYDAPVCLLSRPAAKALTSVQAELKPFGLGLKLFDCYRPQRAVDHFVRWAGDLNDTIMKQRYYPDVSKSALFKEGYIAVHSGHSRGSTVDLTLVDLATGTTLDMGTAFDFFGPASWPASSAVTAQQRANRLLLRGIMVKHGFRPLREEWWHFTLENEPYPDTCFDVPIQ